MTRLHAGSSRSLIFLSLVFAASACGGSSKNTDGGSADGSSGTAALGAACSTGSGCASGSCDTTITDGYCTDSCTGGAHCPSGATCAQTAGGKTECLLSCTKNADCRPGFVCDSEQSVCLPPATTTSTGCETAGCAAGQTCDTTTGQCVTESTATDGGSVSIGGPCTQDSQCGSSSSAFCITEESDFSGGYCTAQCTSASDCGSGGQCVPGIFENANGTAISSCFTGCTTSADCRANYVCQSMASQKFCFPDDCRWTPSICSSSQTCNQSTGACTSLTMTNGYPATFPTPPQVTSGMGAILTNPTLVPIFFNNDNDSTCSVSDMTSFFQGLGGTSYWKALTEYGIGDVDQVIPVTLNQAAPTTIDDSTQNSALEQLLQGFITAGTGGIPKDPTNVLYILVFPSTTTITQGGDSSGGSSCTFGGYHAEMQLNGNDVAYAVIPRCPSAQSGFENDLQVFTAATSHEIIEGSSDPYPDDNPGWFECDEAHIYFDEANDGSEIGDMCENDPEAFWQFSDFNYVVQRFWSNTEALAGHDPCIPAYPGEVYFNSVPVESSTGSFNYLGFDATVTSIDIPVGSTKTIPIASYSDAMASGWSVQALDFNQYMTGGSALLNLALSSSTGKNGGTINLTITANAAGSQTTNGQVDNSELFMMESSQGSGNSQISHIWWGLVTN